MEKFGGVSALRVDGKTSEDSQLSERDKIFNLMMYRHGLRDFCYFWLYLSYRDDCFFCFVRFLVPGIHSSYCQLGDVHA